MRKISNQQEINIWNKTMRKIVFEMENPLESLDS